MMILESSCPTHRIALASSAAPPPSDPIILVIERHRKAFAAFEASTPFQVPSAEGEANCDAAEALASTVPTTMQGVVALLDYLHGFERLLPPDDWHDGLPDGFEAAVRENVRVALKAMV